MKKTLRGRPRLNLELTQILEAVRRHGQVVAAARELHCSDAYIHVRLKRAGFTLAEVLQAPGGIEDQWATTPALRRTAGARTVTTARLRAFQP
jgi:hypothetical protein